MVTLGEVVELVETWWPAAHAEQWDVVGTVVGDRSWPVTHIMLSVDTVGETVTEAISAGADLLISHHPLLLRSVSSLATDRYKGELVTRLIESHTALVTAHTNADMANDGPSAVLADRLGLVHQRPLVSVAGNPELGLGRMGTLSSPLTLSQLAARLAEVLPATAAGIRVAGDYSKPVQRVALCGGAGDGLLTNELVRACDVFITADLRHHPAQELREQARIDGGPALIDVSHWASEWLWCDAAAQRFREELPDVTVSVSQTRTDVWDFVVHHAKAAGER